VLQLRGVTNEGPLRMIPIAALQWAEEQMTAKIVEWSVYGRAAPVE
jgi:hypothetical protein